MDDLAKHVWDTGVALNRTIARDAVAAHRIRQTEPSHVFVLYGNGSVLGVFRSEGGAIEAMNELGESVRATVKRHVLGA